MKVRVGTVVGAAVVVVGVAALWAFWFWRVHNDGPVGGEVAVGSLVAMGFAAGLASARYRDGFVSWAAALVAAVVAYQATYAIDPGWPRGEDPIELVIVIDAVFLLATVGGGHMLGVAARRCGSRIEPARVAAGPR